MEEYRQILENVERIEKKYGSFENFVVRSTFFDDGHRMKMKETSFGPKMQAVYQDLSDLELADLMDYQKLFGRFDGEYF